MKWFLGLFGYMSIAIHQDRMDAANKAYRELNSDLTKQIIELRNRLRDQIDAP